MKFFKLTEKFMEREASSLMLFFPELKLELTYENIKQEYLTDDDETFGVTKIKCVETGELFSIEEINLLPEDQRPNIPYQPWCFVYSDYTDEFEVVNDPN